MVYPERKSTPVGGADRLLSWLDYKAHSIVWRNLADAGAFASRVRDHAARLRGSTLIDSLAPLRYQLRRSGFRGAPAAECFGLFCAALAEHEAPSPQALGAARRMVEGGIVELADATQRRQALGLAAFALALQRDTVHLLCATQRAAEALAESLRAPFSMLGLEVGCVTSSSDLAARQQAYRSFVVCATAREAALDYLRDRTLLSGASGTVGDKLLLRGMRCALVDDANVVMLDEAQMPIAIARDVDVSQERLLYDQALELARALRPEADFAFHEEGVRFTQAASDLLGRLIAPLGGLWAARERREQLIGLALEALHVLQRGEDYRVEQGRVLFPPKPAEEAELTAEHDAVVLKLVEAKEGCAFSARRELVARISTPRFFGRYLHLAGICDDARGLERELWSLYSLKTSLAGARAPRADAIRRLFLTGEAKRAALLQRTLALREAGTSVVLAARTPGEAAALKAALARAGIPEGDVAISLAPAERSVERDGTGPGGLLAVLVVELHDSRRQIAEILRAYGAACGEVLLALDHETMAMHVGGLWTALARLNSAADGEVARPWATWIAAIAERRVERAHAMARQDLAARDQYLHDLLAFSGEGD